MAKRLGIFGGSFDPPHQGHLIVAADAFESLKLDRLLFIPAAQSPLKEESPGASADQRLRMLNAAIEGDARFNVDDLELRRGGVSYTVDTLRVLRERDPDAELVFLLGIDQFRELDRWRAPVEIAALATLAVLSRGGETPELTGPYGAVLAPVSRIDISATEIRRRAAEGKSVRYYVPDRVLEIIEAEKLYRNFEF